MVQRAEINGSHHVRSENVSRADGFTTLADAWMYRDGVPFRRVLDMSIREISLAVACPAYAATTRDVHMSVGRSIAFARKLHRQRLIA